MTYALEDHEGTVSIGGRIITNLCFADDPDDHKETKTAVVWSCFPFIRSGQNHLARHSERWKKTRQTKEEVGRQHQGMDRPGVCQVPEGSGEQGKMEKTGCKIICGSPMTLAVKELMMMMMMMIRKDCKKNQVMLWKFHCTVLRHSMKKNCSKKLMQT